MAAETTKPQTAVATIAPARLPYHPAIEERFGVDRSQWKALCESVFPNAKSTDAIVLALSYCKARKLDIFKRPVHIVPIYDASRGATVETVWPGISEHRTTAMRTGHYAGMEPPRMGPDVTRKFSGTVGKGNFAKKVEVELTFPQYCEITVFRMVGGQRVPFPGPRVYWMEYYSPMGKSGVPNDRWQRAPYQMIEKCAEAAALRRAFPEEIGEAWTADEVGGRATMSDAVPMRDVTPPDEQPEPTRGQFTEEREATDVDHDEGTTEAQPEQQAAAEPEGPYAPADGWPKFAKFSEFEEYATDFLAQATAAQAIAWNAQYAQTLQHYMTKGAAAQKEAVATLLKAYGDLTRAADVFPGDLPSKSAA